MNRKFVFIVLILALVAGFSFAQDLRIQYQYNLNAADPANSFFTFRGPIAYMAADRDQVDMTTGASKLRSTANFQPYRLDVTNKQVFPHGLRGLFLFAVATPDYREIDNLSASRAADGVITIQYVHRGTAYRLRTDQNGRLTFPNVQAERRVIGFIQGAGPQVLSRDFSSAGTAASVNWAAVWNPATPSGRPVAAGNNTQTGPIVADVAAADAMFHWQGDLNVSIAGPMLRIIGELNAVKR